MKKLLAILMALSVCGAVAYSVSAEDGASVDETSVSVSDEASTSTVAETTTAAKKSTAEIINALANDPAAKEAANKLIADIKAGKLTAIKEDGLAVYSATEAVVNKLGFSMKDLQDAGALNDVINGFLKLMGLDADAMDKTIGESTIAQKILDLYYKPEEKTTTAPPTTTTATNPTPTTYSNPDTGAF